MAEKHLGRVIGLLLAVHFVCGLILPYVLLGSSMTPAQSVVETAAARAASLRAAVVLFMPAAALVLSVANGVAGVPPLQRAAGDGVSRWRWRTCRCNWSKAARS